MYFLPWMIAMVPSRPSLGLKNGLGMESIFPTFSTFLM